jgi:RHS repeat-associated protein
VATYTNGTTYFTQADWLGTERARTNVSGVLCGTAASQPFGDSASSWGCFTQSHNFFTGKESDPETSLHYFGARFYTHQFYRFMSPDWAAKPTGVPYAVFGNPQSLNLYSYVGNNPLMHADPDGHCWPVAACAEKVVATISQAQTWVQNKATKTGSPSLAAAATFVSGYYGDLAKGMVSTGTMGTASGACLGGNGCSAGQATLAVGGDLLKAAAVGTLVYGAGAGLAAGAAPSVSTPSLVGFSDSETAMIGQSMRNLSGRGIDTSPLQQLVKADLPAGCCGVSLSTPPTGAALSNQAFSSQAMLDETLRHEIAHLGQNLGQQEFGPDTASALESQANANTQTPQPQ